MKIEIEDVKIKAEPYEIAEIIRQLSGIKGKA